MITVGVSNPSPEQAVTPFGDTLSVLMATVEEMRGPLSKGTTPFVNTIFDVPGRLSGANHSGLKRGYYSKQDKGVVVAVAVPKSSVPP